ncbi:unnamed protein product, partial [Iphiclides podalirius]
MARSEALTVGRGDRKRDEAAQGRYVSIVPILGVRRKRHVTRVIDKRRISIPIEHVRDRELIRNGAASTKLRLENSERSLAPLCRKVWGPRNALPASGRNPLTHTCAPVMREPADISRGAHVTPASVTSRPLSRLAIGRAQGCHSQKLLADVTKDAFSPRPIRGRMSRLLVPIEFHKWLSRGAANVVVFALTRACDVISTPTWTGLSSGRSGRASNRRGRAGALAHAMFAAFASRRETRETESSMPDLNAPKFELGTVARLSD